MSENNTTVLHEGQLAVSTVVQSGEMIKPGGENDTISLINTPRGKQLCVNAYIIGISGDAGLIKVVNTLPEVGESGCFYGVLMQEVDREGRGIIQFFIWYNNAWKASGAYSININPTGIVYEQSWDATNAIETITVSQ